MSTDPTMDFFHELSNKIAVIRSIAVLLSESTDLPDLARQDVRDLDLESKRAAELVEALRTRLTGAS